LLESESFDIHINTVASIIVMLGHSEVNMRVLDVSMETTKSDGCKEISEDDRDTNDVLAVTQERARSSCKDKQKFINLFTQSISELYWVSQLYPRIKE